MTVSDDNTRYLLTINKDFKLQLEKIAYENNRSLNNFIITVLKIYVEDTHNNK